MKVFVIHRSGSRPAALAVFQQVAKYLPWNLTYVLLNCSADVNWKQRAKREISASELVVVFNPDDCEQSENASWEVKTAFNLKKPIVKYSELDPVQVLEAEVRAVYDFAQEFEDNFSRIELDPQTAFEQYSIMINTSEELVRRRQLTNGFFITIIGGLLATTGFFLTEGIIAEEYLIVLLFPTIVGFLLCRSWARLIKNYGQLNRAKFRVINRIEKDLPVGMFSAEWVALGKGLRKDKYQSFTESERIVPLLFSFLLVALGCFVVWQSWDLVTAFAAWAQTWFQMLLPQ